ncbi:MAG: hypothetical protein NC548_52230, partial [Lachnospiraceae bacterium]|nr:hypothetical protein [Lachnospiraceae bacterium]
IDGNGYWGICQWSNEYYPEVEGMNLEEQCEHLVGSIERVMNLFGEDDEYERFITLEDEKEAALRFAKYYEVCGSESYEKRQNCATDALGYFKAREMNAGALTIVTSVQNSINYFLEENYS